MSKILFLASVLFVGSAWAAQDSARTTCEWWNSQPELTKLDFVHGWSRAVEAADRLMKGIGYKLVPVGHRAGSVVIEINVLCERAENRNEDLGEIIQRIAKEKNK
jgi:hypothetical protein